MMIPVIRDLSRASRLPAQQLYLPLSFASILGGMCTVIGTSTNLVIAGLVYEAMTEGGHGRTDSLRELNMFDPALVGMPIALVCIAFMILAGRFFLAGDKDDRRSDAALRRYTAEFEVREDSRIVDRTLEETGIASGDGVQVLYIRRGAERS
jgi:di/tricarboxylate transporter